MNEFLLASLKYFLAIITTVLFVVTLRWINKL